jgi:hypothetical protein
VTTEKAKERGYAGSKTSTNTQDNSSNRRFLVENIQGKESQPRK